MDFRFWIIAGLFCFSSTAYAAEDYGRYVRVDLETPLPTYAELKAKYVPSESKVYNRKYDYHWDMPEVFDRAFRLTIGDYGGSMVRVRHEDEEALMKTLQALPPEAYQYIGPYLHTLPNMPEKILNMPGIKETKNKFPTRIAPQLQDIEDLEFLSPHLYFVLMPEMWPENSTLEQPQKMPVKKVKLQHNEKFYEELKQLVPPQDFGDGVGQGGNKPSKSDLRTIKFGKNSKLSSADVKAVAKSFDGVKEFLAEGNYQNDLYSAGFLLDAFDFDNGNPITMSHVKDMANPCSRFVQKVRVLGLESKLAEKVGEEGFDVNGWGYACDKTIKAYRVSRMSSHMLKAVMAYKKGVGDNVFAEGVDEKDAFQLYLLQYLIMDMYSAPTADVLEVQKNSGEVGEKLKSLRYEIGGSPVSL